MKTEIAEPLPKWMMKRYALLWQSFKDQPFTFEECLSKIQEEKPIVMVLLSRLRKMGWLEVISNQVDARKRVYTLKPIETIFAEMKTE